MAEPLKVQPKIKLLDTRILQIQFTSTKLDKNSTDVLNMNLNTGASLLADKKNQFIIHFDGKFTREESDTKNKEEVFFFNLHMVAVFESDVDITKEFMESHFVAINAPAIGFPFFRAAVAHVLTISGFNTTYIPAINFAVQKDKDKP